MKQREVKFRALHDDMSCEWKYGMLIYEGEVPRIQEKGTMIFWSCLKGTEGQFTGLKDKNDKEIYEGDIVRIDQWSMLFKVIWNDTYAKFTVEKIQIDLGKKMDFIPESISKIIGNIYENPDLLK